MSRTDGASLSHFLFSVNTEVYGSLYEQVIIADRLEILSSSKSKQTFLDAKRARFRKWTHEHLF